MAYFYEETVKVQLLKDIRKLADKLNAHIEMPRFEDTTYLDLCNFQRELQDEYNQKMLTEK